LHDDEKLANLGRALKDMPLQQCGLTMLFSSIQKFFGLAASEVHASHHFPFEVFKGFKGKQHCIVGFAAV
jgi:hypothetical protein